MRNECGETATPERPNRAKAPQSQLCSDQRERGRPRHTINTISASSASAWLVKSLPAPPAARWHPEPRNEDPLLPPLRRDAECVPPVRSPVLPPWPILSLQAVCRTFRQGGPHPCYRARCRNDRSRG